MTTVPLELVPESLVTVVSLVWLAWIVHLVRVATGSLRRRGTRSSMDRRLTMADVQLLRRLHIRP